MGWSYSLDPSSSAKDQVRFLVGDTDENDPLLDDKEIFYLLAQYNNAPINASIRACEAIMAKFARMVNETVGAVKIDFTERIKSMDYLKRALIQRIATEDIRPYCGGISKSDMQQVAENSDRPCPVMTLHEMENYQIAPWVSNQWLWGLAPGSGGGGCGC